jgi:hypothetical protein
MHFPLTADVSGLYTGARLRLPTASKRRESCKCYETRLHVSEARRTRERVGVTGPKAEDVKGPSSLSSLHDLLRGRLRPEQVIEFFRTPAEAEAMLETVLEDEPSWREILYVEPVELVTGGEN